VRVGRLAIAGLATIAVHATIAENPGNRAGASSGERCD
jgi:hypothetical protein